jgi:hypothetical protein
MSALQWIGWPSVGGGLATVNDAASSWRRFDTGGFAGQASAWTASGVWWIDHEPTFLVKCRTPASLAGLRFVCALTDQFSAFSGTTEDLSPFRVIGLRYTSSVPDAGWMPIVADGSTGSCTVGGTPVASIAPSTIYVLAIAVRRTFGGVFLADLSVNYGPVTTVPVPPRCLGSNCIANLSVTGLAAGVMSMEVSAAVGIARASS